MYAAGEGAGLSQGSDLQGFEPHTVKYSVVRVACYSHATRICTPTRKIRMDSSSIATGSVAGLLDFMDFMVQKGYARAATIGPWKSAAKQVFEKVEGERFAEADVRAVDVDEYLERFTTLSIGTYSAETLQAYRSRFRRAVDAYLSYLADPNWRPTMPRSARRTANGERAAKPAPRTPRPTDEPTPTPAAPIPSASLIAYPFPLKSGQVAQLHLPTQLERDDAERMVQFVKALVFDQPRRLSPGTSDDDRESPS